MSVCWWGEACSTADANKQPCLTGKDALNASTFNIKAKATKFVRKEQDQAARHWTQMTCVQVLLILLQGSDSMMWVQNVLSWQSTQKKSGLHLMSLS